MSRHHGIPALLAALLLTAAAAPARGAAGGPDASGYLWTDNADGCTTSVPAFGSGVMDFSAATEVVGPFMLPFDFPFYGRDERRIWISPSGYVTFSDQGPAANLPQALPDPTAPNHLIAANWTPVVDSSLRVELTAEFAHVQWLQLLEPGGSRVLSDLILEPSGNFRMRWLAPALPDPVTVGHENAVGGFGRSIWAEGVGENGFRGPGPARSLCVRAPSALDCSDPKVVRCGQTVEGFVRLELGNNATEYACSPLEFPMQEDVFRVDVDDIARVSVEISSDFADLLRIQNPPCSGESCLDWADQRLDYDFLLPGSYWFVADQSTIGASPLFDFSVSCEPAYQRIDCASSLPGDTRGGSSILADHGCVAESLDGSERLYRLLNPSTQSLTVSLDTLAPDLFVLLYDAEDFEAGSSACLAGGRLGTALADAPPGEYVIVVDSPAGAEGAYTLQVDCGLTLDCSALPEAGCQQLLSGDNTGRRNVLVAYGCTEDALLAGEMVWVIDNPVEQTLRVRFRSSTPGQRLLLLDACSSSRCLLVDELGFSCWLLQPGTYYLVLDGVAGSEGPFEIDVSCSGIVTGVDLQVVRLDTEALRTTCEDSSAAGDALVTVANLGTEDVTVPVEVVVFRDLPPLDGVYSPGTDTLLGNTSIMPPLPAATLTEVTVASAGFLPFRDANVQAQVDTGGAVAEVRETNNARDSAQDCEYRPPIGLFTPAVEWTWNSSTDFPNWVHVDTAPMVGDVDGDGLPEVVIVTSDTPEGFAEGVVRVLSGRDGSELWTATQPGARVWSTSNLALADLDGDGRVEIVGHSYDTRDAEPGQRLVCLDDDGTVLWRSELLIRHPSVIRGGGGASIADIDCDGSPEIVYGANAFTADGGYFWVPEEGGTIGVNDDGRNLDGALSVVVDVDGDGILEVVAGPTAYQLDATDIDPTFGVPTGRILWRADGVLDGFPAVGQFDGDDEPEIVLTNYGFVSLLEGATGDVIWETPIPSGGGGCSLIDLVGGPPTVADFDADCRSEVGVAGADLYAVFETDGSIKWTAPIVDCSSHRTASSVFDFDGDGAAEVAFQDENALRVYRGPDGSLLAEVPAASHTWQEMITIADIDGDASAEILMPLNSPDPDGPRGLQVVGDYDDAWVDTRSIWNQHAYHIGNVREDGRIPGPADGCEEPSWLIHGTYRDQVGSAIFSAPDLTVLFSGTEIIGEGCAQQALVHWRVGNAGARSSLVDTPMWFRVEGDAVERIELPAIAPGEVLAGTTAVPLAAPGLLEVRATVDVDDAGRSLTPECREDNNECVTEVMSMGFPDAPPVPIGPALRATAHGDPDAADITASFNWQLDAGLPRPDGDHYHVFRSTDPSALAFLDVLEPFTDLGFEDSTPRAQDFQLPLVHFYKVFAHDRCEQREQP